MRFGPFLLVLGLGGCCDLDAIRTERLPDGRVGQSYAAELESNCEGNQVDWRLISGELPPGISLSEEGRFRGTPLTTGTFTFTVEAEAVGLTDQRIFIAKGFAITVLP